MNDELQRQDVLLNRVDNHVDNTKMGLNEVQTQAEKVLGKKGEQPSTFLIILCAQPAHTIHLNFATLAPIGCSPFLGLDTLYCKSNNYIIGNCSTIVLVTLSDGSSPRILPGCWPNLVQVCFKQKRLFASHRHSHLLAPEERALNHLWEPRFCCAT